MASVERKKSAGVLAAERRAMLDRKKREEERQAAAGRPLWEALDGQLYIDLVPVVDFIAILDRLVDDGYLKNGESVHAGLRRINSHFHKTGRVSYGGE